MKSIRLVLADDHHLVRASLSLLLQDIADFAVVGEAADGIEAARLVAELQPDVAILDIGMPEASGLEALEKISAAQPACRVIILSMHDDEEHVASALHHGAAGYVLKKSTPQELELAIRAVVNGGTWLSPAVSRQVVEAYLEHTRPAERPDGLTVRQMEVVKLLTEGMRTKEIAFTLGVSVKTIETFRAQIMQKLAIQDIPSLVRYAIRNGISKL